MSKKGEGYFIISKKGLSEVVTTLVIILISLVAIGVIWVVVQNVIQEGSEEIDLGQFTLDLQIKAVQIEDENVTVVVVKRNPGQGEFIGMNFIFSDGQNSEIIREDTSLKELDERTFTFELSEINASNVKTVSVAPIYMLSSGSEKMGNLADQFDVPANKSLGTEQNGGTQGTGVAISENKFAELGFTGAGKKEYSFSSQSIDIIKFTKTVIDPLDVLPGDNQTFTVYVYSPYNITEVTSITELDNSTLNLDFIKISEISFGESEWSASWIVNDTHTIEYRTNVTAIDSQGNSASVTLTWTDSCQSQLTHGAPTSTISTTCNTGASSVGGVDGGNIVLGTNVNLIIDSGSNFIFNSGKTITVTASGARITPSGGSFGNGYLFYTDVDGDGRGASSTLSWSLSSSVSQKVRASSALSTSDCADGDAAKYQLLTGYTNSDGDAYGTGTSQQVCSGSSLPSGYASQGGDCLDSSNLVYPGANPQPGTLNGGDYDCSGAVQKGWGWGSDPNSMYASIRDSSCIEYFANNLGCGDSGNGDPFDCVDFPVPQVYCK